MLAAARQIMWHQIPPLRRALYLEIPATAPLAYMPFGPRLMDTPNARIELDLELLGSGGTYGSALTNKFLLWAAPTSTKGVGFRMGSTSTYYTCGTQTTSSNNIELATTPLWGRHLFVADGPNDRVELDGTRKGSTGPASMFAANLSSYAANTSSLCFCSTNSATAAEWARGVRLYGFRAWVGGVLVRDIVPCTGIAQAECGLYDRVTGGVWGPAAAAYTANTGATAAGPDLGPLPLGPGPHPVEYAELRGPNADGTPNGLNFALSSGLMPSMSERLWFKCRLPNPASGYGAAFSSYVNENSATLRMTCWNGSSRNVGIWLGYKSSGSGLSYDTVATYSTLEGWLTRNAFRVKSSGRDMTITNKPDPLAETMPGALRLMFSANCRLHYLRLGTRLDVVPVRYGARAYLLDRVSRKLLGGGYNCGPDIAVAPTEVLS